MPITSKILKQNDDLDDILEEEDEIEDEEEFEMEEEIPTPKRRRPKQKVDDSIHVVLLEATTYLMGGVTFKRGVPVKMPRSKLSKFKDNAWFSIRY